MAVMAYGGDDEADADDYMLWLFCTLCAVLLHATQALLTMMTSGTCSVHEGSLLQVIRTCYNIFLASKKPINQVRACSC